jgi:hypothetical protein
MLSHSFSATTHNQPHPCPGHSSGPYAWVRRRHHQPASATSAAQIPMTHFLIGATKPEKIQPRLQNLGKAGTCQPNLRSSITACMLSRLQGHRGVLLLRDTCYLQDKIPVPRVTTIRINPRRQGACLKVDGDDTMCMPARMDTG